MERARCGKCGRHVELRLGFCFDCAQGGEERAAKRSVLEHMAKAVENVRKRRWQYAYYDITWAWQRLTRTGDYSKGGTFDFEGYDWR